MPRNRDRNTKREMDIYVILSEISDEFIVWKVKSGNTYKAFADHVRLKSWRTKNLFTRSIEQKKMPTMYLLETVNCSQREAMKHCIVWTKYFLDHNRIPLAGDTMIAYVNELDEESLRIYEQIEARLFEEVINSETAIVENYQPKIWSKNEEAEQKGKKKRRETTITFNEELYKIVKKKADYLGLPLAKYGRIMMVNGFVFRFDFAEYLKEIRSIKRVMQDIQKAIYQSGRYFPSDLENLEKCINEVNDVQRKMMKNTARVVRKQAEKMPEELNEKHKD